MPNQSPYYCNVRHAPTTPPSPPNCRAHCCKHKTNTGEHQEYFKYQSWYGHKTSVALARSLAALRPPPGSRPPALTPRPTTAMTARAAVGEVGSASLLPSKCP
jgi:hypothetical protein